MKNKTLPNTNMVVTSVASFFLVCAASSAYAGFESGNDLFKSCEGEMPADQKYFAEAYCFGFVIGVADEVLGVASTSGFSPFCLEHGVTQKQVHDVVIKWLGNHPEQRHYSASSLVVASLTEAFPCHQ